MKLERIKVMVRGAVQGVGFRPFVYRLAVELALDGWVRNSSDGVMMELEGPPLVLNEFLLRLDRQKPSLAFIQSLEFSYLDSVGYDGFEIRSSDAGGAKRALILPDVATCAECLGEILDPKNRRYLYPFTNCTNCGPRFSIIESLPYDRLNTSMKEFVMCAECRGEYDDPAGRRFHAQPNCCAACGPRLQLWDAQGKILAEHGDALMGAARAIRDGQIVALKALGGFQLMVDATNDYAVRRLRGRKRREEKPFALMYPSLDGARQTCQIDSGEERLLSSAEAPIVILRRKTPLDGPAPVLALSALRPSLVATSLCDPPSGGASSKRGSAACIAPAVAPRNPYLGVMLPYSPLHHLLLRELGFPVVATSGNLSEEPICIEEREALLRLQGIADVFLVHDRPIVRHVDDSVARLLLGREQILRRARGYAPLPIPSPVELPAILAVGGQMKNSVAFGIGRDIFLSQHVGDLETAQAVRAFRRATSDLGRLYQTTPEIVACDLHPEYVSTQHARQMGGSCVGVPHHYAHVAACMAENDLEPPVLGVCWDGTGYGPDGTLWGGEFLMADERSFERVAHFRQFLLPGGEVAIKQPRRIALGVLYEILGPAVFERRDLLPIHAFTRNELDLIRQALHKRINAPITSSAGRLFDAVASLAGLRHRASFEGQAAMDVEFAIQPGTEDHYPFHWESGETSVIDWQPIILRIIDDLRRGERVGKIAARFHNTLAEIIVAMATKVGVPSVAVTGGCFQNQYLSQRAVQRLEQAGFRPYWHQRVPPNDGGIALGQVMVAARARACVPDVEECCSASQG